MDPITPLRKSGRQRKPNPKYSNDVLEKEILAVLSSDSEAAHAVPLPDESDVANSDDDFDIEKSATREEIHGGGAITDDDASMDSSGDREASDGSGVATPVESDADVMSLDDLAVVENAGTPARSTGARGARRRKVSRYMNLPRSKIHSRGLANPNNHVSKSVHWKQTFGSADEDLLPIVHVRDQWTGRQDVTFPSRASLDSMITRGEAGDAAFFGVEHEKLKKEATKGWDWYYLERGKQFRKRQKVERVGEDEARRKYMLDSKGKHRVLLGPWKKQKVYELGIGESLDFGDAWWVAGKGRGKPRDPGGDLEQQHAGRGGADRPDDDTLMDDAPAHVAPSPEAETPPNGTSTQENRRVREGWLLNLDGRIQAMGWAPNQKGTTQHLAVSVLSSQKQKESAPPIEPKGAPAFTPSAPYPASIQVWGFEALAHCDGARKIDMTVKPRLRLVMCTDWGDMRRLSWCPVPRDFRKEDESSNRVHLGLLAGVWTDGQVRVLHISVPKGRDAETEYGKHSFHFSTTASSANTCMQSKSKQPPSQPSHPVPSAHAYPGSLPPT